MTNQYEITYLTDAQLTDEKRAEVDGVIDTAIATLGGSITTTVPTTRRRLSYPIQKQTVAFSRAVNVELDPAHIEELRKIIRKTAGVLRLYVINTPPRESVTLEMMTKTLEQDSKEKATKKEEKPVTMQEVETGIESALQEEVK